MSDREPTNAELLAAINAVRTDLGADMTAVEGSLRGDIVQLGTHLREEIAKSRGETAKLIEGVQVSIDGIREDLTVLGGANDRLHRLNENTREEARDIARDLANIERLLRKHGTRLDDLEKRAPKP
jgi:hypothetical protein